MDKTPKVTSVGGIFFYSNNSEKTKEWYSEKLGLEVNEWGSSNNWVTILDSIETYDYVKFVHIMKDDGNKIELWEPIDRVFTEMGGKTTK